MNVSPISPLLRALEQRDCPATRISTDSAEGATTMARTYGPWLRQQRHSRGWNVSYMARKLREAATSAGDTLPARECLIIMIHRWEGDRSGISERYRLHYSKAFKIPIGQFGKAAAHALAGNSPAPAQQPIAGSEVPANDPSAGLAELMSTDTSPQRSSGASVSEREGQGRRGLIGAQVLAIAHQSSEHAQEAERRDIGEATMEHFQAVVNQLSRDLLTSEPVTLFFRMRDARDRLHAAAGMRSWPAGQRELYFLLGCLNSLMATAAQHVGNPAAAEELARAGLAYAIVNGDNSLIARLRLDLAMIAYWSGWLRDCLDQAGNGLEHATDGPTTAHLHLTRARAAARMGDTGTAWQAIRASQKARDRECSATDLAHVVSQIRFSPAAHHYHTGSALLEIPGAGQDALTELERAIELYTAAAEPGHGHDHDHMTARVNLAAARLRAHDLDAAHIAVGPVLALPWSCRVSSLAHSFTRVRAELAAPRYHGSPEAAAFDAQIEQFCAHSIADHPHDTPADAP